MAQSSFSYFRIYFSIQAFAKYEIVVFCAKYSRNAITKSKPIIPYL
jgi:hypothetical protein